MSTTGSRRDQQRDEDVVARDLDRVAVGELAGVLLGLQLVLQFDALAGDVLGADLGAVLQGDLDALFAVDQLGLLGLVLLDVVDGLPGVDVLDPANIGHQRTAEQHQKYCQQNPQQRPTRQALHIHPFEDRTVGTGLLIPVP